MKKIVLFCMAGLSTSILVEKMREAAKIKGFECTVDAYAIGNAAKEGADADMVLLGPQVRLQLDQIKSLLNCPVEVVDMMAYGMMDGKQVIERVIEVIGE